VNEILTMHMGPDFILVNLSVNFVDDARADDIERIVSDLDRKIKETFPRVERIFVEAEAWRAKDVTGAPSPH
jgi:divalent metal cation (Fe/Co/Zn/Cd) transporter